MREQVVFKIADIILRAESEQRLEPGQGDHAYRYRNFVLKVKPRRFDIDLSIEIKPRYQRFYPEILFETKRGRPAGQE